MAYFYHNEESGKVMDLEITSLDIETIARSWTKARECYIAGLIDDSTYIRLVIETAMYYTVAGSCPDAISMLRMVDAEYWDTEVYFELDKDRSDGTEWFASVLKTLGTNLERAGYCHFGVNTVGEVS
jgi:hypothetical protein